MEIESDLFEELHLPIQSIHDELFEKNGINVDILRLDQTDRVISGNKWFKLKYNILQAKLEQKKQLITFGGAYSNHIHAVAAAGERWGFETIALIRGEEVLPLNPTLESCKQMKMKFKYVSRAEYRLRHVAQYIYDIQNRYPDAYIIPEGGTNALAIKGSGEIWNYIPQGYHFIILAGGTGGTAAGVIAKGRRDTTVIVIQVLKADKYLSRQLKNYFAMYGYYDLAPYEVHDEYHAGGYAHYNDEIIATSERLNEEHGIPLDYLYTSKVYFAMRDLTLKKRFPTGSKILMLHTGGLQGNLGFAERYKNRITKNI